MITISLEDFTIELKDGSIKNVGSSTKTSTVKLYDVTTTTAREFGNDRIKLEFIDEDQNQVEIALGHETISTLITELQNLDADLNNQD